MATDEPRGPWPDIAIPPGEVLAEALEAMALTQTELASRMGRPTQAINEIVRAKKAITPETALELERVLGTPAYVWLNLERDYQFNRARLADLERVREQLPLLADFPYGEMARLGWVATTRHRTDRVRELLRFFGVGSLDRVRQVEAVAYRKSVGKRVSSGALAAWLRKGEVDAQHIRTEPFDRSALHGRLEGLRTLTRQPIEKAYAEARDVLARNGVALVCVTHLRGTYAQGATRWLRPDRAMVQLSVRYRYDDVFWFSLFHEIAHILRHGKRQVFVELTGQPKTQEERAADRFAADLLIPPRDVRALKALAPYSRANVCAFAEGIGVAPSIVVGRLHHERLLDHKHLNDLRRRLVLKPE